jgi:hypothetical protein
MEYNAVAHQLSQIAGSAPECILTTMLEDTDLSGGDPYKEYIIQVRNAN